jgi:ferritin-like metal-binding protein YciE
VEEEVLDAGLISAAQRVEHYEMAAYGCLKTYAGLLGNQKATRLLEETLSEEKRADELLTQIAERSINVEAMEAGTGGGATTERGGSSKRGSNR